MSKLIDEKSGLFFEYSIICDDPWLFRHNDAFLLTGGNPFVYRRALNELGSFDRKEEVPQGITEAVTGRYRKPGFPAGSYTIKKDTNRNRGIYCEGCYGYILTADGHDVARGSFDVDGFRSVKVVQLQGKKGFRELVEPLMFEKMFVHLIAEEMQKLGAKTIKGITHAAHPSRHEDNDKIVRLMKRRYDGTFRQMGFDYSDDGSYMHRPLPLTA